MNRTRPRRLELVGLAGVGKSHLKARLVGRLTAPVADVTAQRLTLARLPWLLPALARIAPLLWYIVRTPGGDARRRWQTLQLFTLYAWQESVAAHAGPRPRYLVSDEGWFHKLRRLRRVLGGHVSFESLPTSVRERLFRPDAVVLVSADPMEICARKLERAGVPVTEESLRRRYDEADVLGQWQELDQSRRDLEQAAAHHVVAAVEIDYRRDYDIDRELLPLLSSLGFD